MVDERRAIDAPRVGLAQHDVHTFGSEQGDELRAVFRPAQGGHRRRFGHVAEFPLLYLLLACGAPSPERLVPVAFSETGGFDRRAGLVPLAVERGIHEPAVFPAPNLPATLLYGCIIEREQGTVFSERLELVPAGYAFQNIPYLLLHVACRSTHAPRRFVLYLQLAFSGVQPVFLLQCTGNVLTPATDEAVADFLSLPVHAKRYDMQVVAVDVFVFEHRIRLVAITEPCKILLGYGRQFRIVEAVVGVRIEGDMHDRF